MARQIQAHAVGHTPSSRFWAQALASIFAAKKNAEIAPGVGRHTDLHLVLKDGPFPIWDHIPSELLKMYERYSAEVNKFGNQMVQELDKFLATPPEGLCKQIEDSKLERPEISEENTQANASAGSAAAEEMQADEFEEQPDQKAE